MKLPVNAPSLSAEGLAELARATLETLLVFFVICATLLALRYVSIRLLSGIARRTAFNWDDILVEVMRKKARAWILGLAAAGIAALSAPLPAAARGAAWALIVGVTAYLLAAAVRALIENGGRTAVREGAHTTLDRGARSSIRFLAAAVQALVWVAAFLFLLSTLGVQITSLIAGLGVGGIVLGFALQAILTDLFSSFTIQFDQPFREGDFIILGDHMGTVERIGVQSTRIRALEGEEITIPNKDITSSRILNYARMRERRVVFAFRILLETEMRKMRLVPDIVRAAIEAQEDVRFDRAHLKEFGADAFVYEAVYYVLSSDYNRFMDIHQEVLFSLRDALDKEGISLAYPLRRVRIASAPEGEAVVAAER